MKDTERSMRPAAYLFDMDGLLLDTERVMLDVGILLATQRGLPEETARAFFLSLIGSSSHHTQTQLQRFIPGDRGSGSFYTEWYDAVGIRLKNHVPLRPTVQETLTSLQRENARMAVVTSTRGALARHHLEMAGLDGFFDHIVGGDEVAANKPDPAPYLKAAALLGLDPAQCAAFEDSDRGTESAVRAGCVTVQIPDLRPEGVVVPNLGQERASTLAGAVIVAQRLFFAKHSKP